MHEMRKAEFYRSHSDTKKDNIQKHDRERHKVLSNQSSYPASKSTDRDHRPAKHKIHCEKCSRQQMQKEKFRITRRQIFKIAKVQGAIRVCGEWSEHISSGGKKYYYHNKRELSQWEKPSEWNNSRAVDVKRAKPNASSQHRIVATKQSSSGDSEQQQSANKHKYHHNEKQRHNYTKQNSTQDTLKDRDYRNLESSNVGKDRDYRDIDYRDSDKHRQDKDYRQSNISNSNNDKLSYTDCNGGVSSRTSTPRNLTDPNNADRNDSPNTSISGESLLSNHLALSKTESNDSNGSLPKTEGEKAALVQKLSTALSQANSTTGDNNSSQHLKNALQLLLNAAVRNQSQSDESQPAEKRARVQSQSEDIISKSSLLGDPLPSNITTLQYFYEEQLALQSLNLPAETLNRQCQRMMGDSHNIHVHQTSQLGTQLKISRSQVRAAEIHATLQEQRILYLRQQIKDLDKVNTESPYT